MGTRRADRRGPPHRPLRSLKRRREMRLDGKVAIVTGANGEFGSAIVPGFAKEGCEIACVDWTQDDADKAAAKVQAFGRRALGLGVDLRDNAQVEMMVRRVVDE